VVPARAKEAPGPQSRSPNDGTNWSIQVYGRERDVPCRCEGKHMVKEAKFFRRQAIKAESLARAMMDDAETAQNFSNLAQAYRSQADTIKKSKKEEKAARKKSPRTGS
jgi:hypothetical protein